MGRVRGSIQLFDGRSAAWSVLRRSLWAGGAVIGLLGLRESPVVPMLLLGLAVLAALEQVYWMHPDRLAAVVAMPADVTLLDRWRADLEQLAQPCTDSTAPTKPEVSSDRSSSDVT